MKNVLSIFAVLSLVACSTTTPPVKAQVAEQPRQVVATPAMSSLDGVPGWFTSIPESADTIYAVGDGVSSNYSGAIGNARANAFETICQAVGGKVRSQTKVYRNDTETSSTNITTTVIRNFCPDVDVSGAMIVKQAVVQEGTRKRAYVLVALPTGPAKAVTAAKEVKRQEVETKDAMTKELKELDNLVKPEGTPKAESNVAPVTTDDKTSELKLLDVDNKEYVAKRDATLQKPNAVVGQVIVQ